MGSAARHRQRWKNSGGMNKLSRLVIVGASGHGKVIADIAKLNGYDDIVFLDDDEAVTECAGYPVIGRSCDFSKVEQDVVVAVGNAKIRSRIQEDFEDHGFRPVTLIHPGATIADSAEIGAGSVIMAGAVINPYAQLGKGCIVNTCASVDHDCVLGDYVHVAVGAHLCGTVSIGEYTWVGAGATVSNNISICPECMIGAGAVVMKNIEEAGAYVGVPAGKISYSMEMSEIEEDIQDWEKLKKEHNVK